MFVTLLYNVKDMSENKNKTIIAILVLLLLLTGSGLAYFMFKNKTVTTELVEVTEAKNDLDILHKELQQEYEQSLAQLEALEGENAGLDSLLEIKKEELRKNKEYIASILSNKNASAAELAQARNLIAQLTGQRKALESQVDSLKALNIELETTNLVLLEENELIKISLDSVSTEATQLDAENVSLKKEKDLASILTAKNVVAQGVKTKGADKESESKKASGTDKIKICLDLQENKIAPEGPTSILVRIIGPNGTTLALQALGSGVFRDELSGQQMQYTYEITPSFKREGKSICSYWDQNTGYASGKYQVEVYQKGFQIGKTSFDLK